jgi:hypothetical protein
VLVADACGNPVPGVTVTFAVGAGGGSLTGASATTAESGVAAVGGWTLGAVAGANTLTASADGVAAAETFTATGTVGAAAVIATQAGDGATLTVGSLHPIAVRVADAHGNPVPGHAVSWAAADGTVGVTSSITDAGGVAWAVWKLGAAVGTQTATAASAGLAGSPVTFAVTTTPLPPPTHSVDLVLHRVAAGVGPVRVSSGVPLPRGWLRAADLWQVRLVADGQEQPVHVAALAGTHPDGSLRAMLLQLEYPLSVGSDVPATLELGVPRLTTDPPAPGERPSYPDAVALPSSAEYLVSTELVGPTITAAASAALGPAFRSYEDSLAKYADHHWWRADSTNNFYDRALLYYALWARTGNPEHWRRATRTAIQYRRDSLEAHNYRPQAHWSHLEGLEKHYLLTGNDSSYGAVLGVAQDMTRFAYALADTVRLDHRHMARVLEAYLLAWRLTTPQPEAATWAAYLSDGVTKVLSTQRPDGSYRSKVFCYESANYMTGILNDVLVRIHDQYQADARIADAVRRAMDFLWDTQMVTAPGTTFQYLSGYCEGVGSVNPAPDLNGLIVNGFGWVHRQTGDPAYRDRGDAVLDGMRWAWFGGSKQFTQAYANSYRYLGYRR